MPKKSRPLMERYDEQVDRSGGPDACWPWLGTIRPDGYGVIRDARGLHRSHRLALSRGGDEPAQNVLHSCDNPPCCNPAHLRYGTQGENVEDMHKRGRRGYKSRFSVEDLVAIDLALSGGASQTAVAREYGVSPSYISMLASGSRGASIRKE